MCVCIARENKDAMQSILLIRSLSRRPFPLSPVSFLRYNCPSTISLSLLPFYSTFTPLMITITVIRICSRRAGCVYACYTCGCVCVKHFFLDIAKLNFYTILMII